jgi:phosphopantothenoylcysteine decarboxylase/phosphopantothenate--cysteine ligase
VTTAVEMLAGSLALAAGLRCVHRLCRGGRLPPGDRGGAEDQEVRRELTLTLVRNPDIVASIAALSPGAPFTVGFAAETERLREHARDKLRARACR